jgi:hypothetical protein
MTGMNHKLYRFHALSSAWHYMWSEAFLIFVYALLVLVEPAGALALRFADRGLFMQSTLPGVTTAYTISFQYMSPTAVGSVDMLFCIDPIPYMPCVPPAGLDTSHAVLSTQTGETGYSIQTETTNHIILSRPVTPITASGLSSYTFSNIVNPTNVTQSFSIRLKSLGTTDGSGPQIDFGSIKGQTTNAIIIETQVPPMLIFCLAQQVELGCTGTNDTYYTDMGDLSPDNTLTAQSQLAVGTNATQGFAVTVNGSPPAAGTHVIDGAAVPTASEQGTNQFGINLVANSDPTIGHDPEGTFTNAVPTTDYSQPDMYKYVSGDVVASSPNVSLMKKFTVSYILNSSQNLHPGVYTTTINYIASGRF